MAKLYVEEERWAGQNRFRAVVAGPGTKKQRQYSKFQTHLKTKKSTIYLLLRPHPNKP
jgi:hypothetical protein